MLIPTRTSARRSGTILVWMALSLVAIVGVVGIAVDCGRMLSERQQAQATADASALAAAGVLYQEYPSNGGLDKQGNARAAALAMSATNGITNGSNGVVTVNVPPTSGNFAGQAGYAEVNVSRQMSASFSAIFRASTLTVGARAVARGIMTSQPAASGVYVLASTGKGAFHATGTTALNIVNGSLYVNSSDANAVQTDSGSHITASGYYFVGSGYNAGALTGPITQPAPAVADPLAAAPPPSFSAYSVQSSSALNVNGTVTLQPGVYIGGISMANGNLTLQPGIYLMNGGGFKINNGTVNGTGVMIYNGGDSSHTAGPVNVAGSATVTVSPPTTGTYAGITIFQDRQNTQKMVITAAHDKNITGAIYAPAAEVDLAGPTTAGSMDTIGGPVICLITQVQGQFQIKPGSGSSGTPKHQYGLVE
jgi:Flp pilus assembly protein TadG